MKYSPHPQGKVKLLGIIRFQNVNAPPREKVKLLDIIRFQNVNAQEPLPPPPTPEKK